MTGIEAPHRQRTLADYVAIVRRRLWVVVIPVVFAPLAAYFYSSQQAVSYAAYSEVLLSRQDLGSVLSGTTNADIFTDADRFAQTQAALARVETVAQNALKRAGVSDITPARLLAASSVSPRGNADILRFTVENGDPLVAAKLATAYAQALAEYRLKLDTASLANARKDIERNLSRIRASEQTDTDLYRDLVRKAQELRTRELLQQRAQVVRAADDGTQVAPTPLRNAVLGLGVGVLLGLAAAFLWEALDRRVRDEEEIHRALEIPLLARLPAPKSDRLGMLIDPWDENAEAVRRLRTSVEFANLDLKAKVMMVTSCVGEEGKTTTLSNLAVALARAGHRVALVDLDLRKPKVDRIFGLELRPGLADVAIERIELDRALVPVRLRTAEPVQLARATRRGSREHPGTGGSPHEPLGELFVLPSGFLPASPGELVGTQAVATVISRLRDEMDFVLVDAPPMLTVSDAAVLSKRVDAILVVVRLGVVNRPMLRDLERELDASPTPKLGFILTGAGAAELYGAGTPAYIVRNPRTDTRVTSESDDVDEHDLGAESLDAPPSTARATSELRQLPTGEHGAG
jgi:tyrosine-protein kinase